jgi:hypothetical protein
MTANPNNVYKGVNSLRDYYNPEIQPALPLVEIPDVLNPYRQDGVPHLRKDDDHATSAQRQSSSRYIAPIRLSHVR